MTRADRQAPTRKSTPACRPTSRRGTRSTPSGLNSVPDRLVSGPPVPYHRGGRTGAAGKVQRPNSQRSTLELRSGMNIRTRVWTARPEAGCQVLLRKEVIQPHLPVRLPCYDFVPIASPTFDGSLPQGVGPPASGVTDFRDVTGGVYKARERIHRSVADLRLLATPTSWGRVADPNPN